MTGFDHRMADFGASGFDGLPEWDERPPASIPPGLSKEFTQMLYGDTPEARMRTVLLAVATLVASSLYMAGVFVAAIAWGNHIAAIGAVVTAGLCYLSYMAQMQRAHERVGEALVIVSVVAGVIAGVSLLVW